MNENKKELIKALSNLAQLDIDAVHAYDQAIKEIGDPIIKERLVQFQKEHRNHISGLSRQIKDLGGQPPEKSKDFKGYVIEAIAAIRSFTDLKSCAVPSVENKNEVKNSWIRKIQ